MSSPLMRGSPTRDGYVSVPGRDPAEEGQDAKPSKKTFVGLHAARDSLIPLRRRTKETVRPTVKDISPTAAAKRREERLDHLMKAQYLRGGGNSMALAEESFVRTPSGDYDSDASTCNQRGHQLITSMMFQCTMAVAIIVNSIVIGLESDMPQFGATWQIAENLLLVIFTVELSLRLIVLGLQQYFLWGGSDFWWNVFDLFIVMIGVLDAVLYWISPKGASEGSYATVFRVVRLMRILRILRIVRFLKQLYMLAFGFMEAAQAVLWVTILMAFGLYVCSILLVRTIGHVAESDPYHDILHERFGTIPVSMLTLFQLMSVPDLRDFMEVLLDRPVFCCFLVIFIIFGSFGVLALLNGVICEGMFDKNQTRVEEERVEREVKRKMLSEEIADVFDSVALEHVGICYKEQIAEMLPVIAEMFEAYNVSFAKQDLDGIVNVLGSDLEGFVRKDEFCNGVLSIAEDVRPLSILEVHYAVSLVQSKVETCADVLEDLHDFAQDMTSYKEDFELLRKEHSQSLSKICDRITEIVMAKQKADYSSNIHVSPQQALPDWASDLSDAVKQLRLQSEVPDWAIDLNDAVKQLLLQPAVPDWAADLSDTMKLLRTEAEALTRCVRELSVKEGGGKNLLPCDSHLARRSQSALHQEHANSDDRQKAPEPSTKEGQELMDLAAAAEQRPEQMLSATELRHNECEAALQDMKSSVVHMLQQVDKLVENGTFADTDSAKCTRQLHTASVGLAQLQGLSSEISRGGASDLSSGISGSAVEMELRCVVNELTAQAEKLLIGPKRLLARLEHSQLKSNHEPEAVAEASDSMPKPSSIANTSAHSQTGAVLHDQMTCDFEVGVAKCSQLSHPETD